MRTLLLSKLHWKQKSPQTGTQEAPERLGRDQTPFIPGPTPRTVRERSIDAPIADHLSGLSISATSLLDWPSQQGPELPAKRVPQGALKRGESAKGNKGSKLCQGATPWGREQLRRTLAGPGLPLWSGAETPGGNCHRSGNRWHSSTADPLGEVQLPASVRLPVFPGGTRHSPPSDPLHTPKNLCV